MTIKLWNIFIRICDLLSFFASSSRLYFLGYLVAYTAGGKIISNTKTKQLKTMFQ